MSAQVFVDPYSYENPTNYPGVNPNSFVNRFSDWLGTSNYRGEYDAWVSAQDREYERQATNSARAWDEYMDSTKYQRMVKDLEAAGLNPWLAIQSGVGSGSSTTTASSGSSARQHSSDSKKSGSDVVKSAAMLLLAGAKIMALLG